MAQVTFPNIGGSPAFDAVTLDAGQAALTVGTVAHGALAQATVGAVGSDVFTPTSNCTYLLSVRIQDASTGSASNAAHDLVTFTVVGSWTPTVINHTATLGTCATTWSNNAGALKLAVGSGTTWYVDVVILARFPA